MKNKVLLPILAGCILLIWSCNSEQPAAADEGEIPQKIQEQFKSQFATQSTVNWEVEDEKYEASFTENGVETTVVFDREGNLVETETTIEPELVPQNISAYIAQGYPGANLLKAEKITNQAGNFYEIEIGNDTMPDVELTFDADGNYLHSASEDSEGYEDERTAHDDSEVGLDINTLPESIITYTTSNYPDFSIVGADKEVTAGKTYIDVELNGPDGEVVELVFDEAGNFIKIENDDD